MSTRPRTAKLRTLLELAGEIYQRGGVDHELWPSEILEATKVRSLEKDTHTGGFDGGRYGWLSVPMDVLQRDLNVGTAISGGNLVGSPRSRGAPSLRGFSVVADSGATELTFPEGTNAPSFGAATAPTAGWVASEGADVPESDSSFALRAVAPKTLGLSTKLTRRLMLLGGDAADQLIRGELLQAIGRGIDKAALQGTGTGGEPLGLVGTAGVHAQAGAELAWAGVQAMLEAVSTAGARDADIRFIAAPGVRKLLSQRERAAGNGPIWDGDRIAGFSASVSNECPANTLICGAWPSLVLSTHGAVNLIVDRLRVTDGSARMIAMVDADVTLAHPAAFSVAGSIT